MEGQPFSASCETNRRKIVDHSNSYCHKAVLEYLKNKKEDKAAKQWKSAEKHLDAKDCHKYQVTANMFRIVYTEVKLNIPFFPPKNRGIGLNCRR